MDTGSVYWKEQQYDYDMCGANPHPQNRNRDKPDISSASDGEYIFRRW